MRVNPRFKLERWGEWYDMWNQGRGIPISKIAYDNRISDRAIRIGFKTLEKYIKSGLLEKAE